ncbi:sensor histidine kinase [Antrihabitans cavernicola]|nr:histidine kinase [Spelaeibacter cavernicola]
MKVSESISMARYLERLRDHFEAHGYGYPISYLAICDGGILLAVVASVAQRYSQLLAVWTILAVAFCAWPLVWFQLTGRTSAVMSTFTAICATSLFLLEPVSPDFSPAILAIWLAVASATASLRVSLIAAAASLVTLVVPALDGRLSQAPFWIVAIGFGWVVGYMMQVQLRLLHEERASHAARELKAAADERSRIAREVHDVVAHSLSITLLHLTGARRALEEDRDVDDAVDALGDAERVGRQAMADIRRTVGLLDPAPATAPPEPDLADIDDLVADFRRAGQSVDYALVGDPKAVSAVIGLGLFRAAQESLSNVAKHAPGQGARIDVAIDEEVATLTVCNPLPPRHREPGTGSGIKGMCERANLLGGTSQAGRHGDDWVVRVAIPLEPDANTSRCLQQLLRRQP